MSDSIGTSEDPPRLTLVQTLWEIHWTLVFLIGCVAAIGFTMLYSAAGGAFHPWAIRQMVRFLASLILMFTIVLIDIRFWLRYAYVIYAIGLILLIAVEVKGRVGMGAQRWIDLKFLVLQPSEVMKIALILALARYFHNLNMEEVGRPLMLLVPIAMLLTPTALVLRQPDLGTAMMLVAQAGAIMFAAGVRWWKFLLVGTGGLAMIPIAWQFLRDYQQRRVLTFLNPEQDPLGAGYHITQSKIALGSGGMWGKGFVQGTQSHLNFLPEKQTDFVFTMLAEEWGFAGALFLILLYVLILIYGFTIALSSASQFGRLVAMGFVSTLFLYVFINIAMVIGVVPVVGVPLPLVSYGGTAMLTVMIGFGLVLCVSVQRGTRIDRRGLKEG